jgi:hypothetical protein
VETKLIEERFGRVGQQAQRKRPFVMQTHRLLPVPHVDLLVWTVNLAPSAP